VILQYSGHALYSLKPYPNQAKSVLAVIIFEALRVCGALEGARMIGNRDATTGKLQTRTKHQFVSKGRLL